MRVMERDERTSFTLKQPKSWNFSQNEEASSPVSVKVSLGSFASNISHIYTHQSTNSSLSSRWWEQCGCNQPLTEAFGQPGTSWADSDVASRAGTFLTEAESFSRWNKIRRFFLSKQTKSCLKTAPA